MKYKLTLDVNQGEYQEEITIHTQHEISYDHLTGILVIEGHAAIELNDLQFISIERILE